MMIMKKVIMMNPSAQLLATFCDTHRDIFPDLTGIYSRYTGQQIWKQKCPVYWEWLVYNCPVYCSLIRIRLCTVRLPYVRIRIVGDPFQTIVNAIFNKNFNIYHQKLLKAVIAYTIYSIHTVRTLDIISRMHHTMFTSIRFVRSISFASIMWHAHVIISADNIAYYALHNTLKFIKHTSKTL